VSFILDLISVAIKRQQIKSSIYTQSKCQFNGTGKPI